MTTIERCDAGDRHFDYCLWPYEPLTPSAGKLRSATLLWHLLDVCEFGPKVRLCCEALRTGLGPFQTVWGVKKRNGRFSLEFYFYDYARVERRVSVQRVLQILAPIVPCALSISNDRPYFMFSLDLDDEITARPSGMETVNIYIGNPGSSVSSGINYKLSKDGLRLDNLYYFFDAQRQRDDIVAKVACSAHLDLRRTDMTSILWPDMLASAGVVVVANKQANDGVYFSRISVDALTRFLSRVDFCPAFGAFVAANRDDLDHMLFDIGFDYILYAGRISVIKTAVYGLL